MQSIKLFNLALEGENYDYVTIALLGLQTGYIIDPKCSTKEVYDFLLSQKIDRISTFYKNWEDITTRNRFELFIDQIIHYISYGVYTQNDSDYTIDYSTYKTISSATQDEIINKCYVMLSGVALASDTVFDIFEIFDRFNIRPDINRIKNKEALCIMYSRFNITPPSVDEMVRYLIYLSTGKTMLIKDKETMKAILFSKIDASEFIAKNFVVLAGCFFRHKRIFLTLKKANKNNAKIINQLRKGANTLHKPMNKNNFYNEDMDVEQLTNFKKVSILEGLYNKNNKYKNFIIRNGKFWIDNNTNKKEMNNRLYYKLYTSLTSSIAGKLRGKTFYMPDSVDYTVPTSEKQFIGSFPLGTSIKRKKNTVVGIHWRGEDGARDIDLSLLDSEGNKIGRNASYTNVHGCVYSGDMTLADPSATELMLLGGKEDMVICVNRYSGDELSKYKFFVGSSDTIENNTMIDNIDIQCDIISDIREQTLGIVLGDKIVIQKLRKGNNRVSNGNTISNAFIEYNKTKGYVMMRDLLKDAGLIETQNKENCDFDFSNPSKDLFISILN